MKDSSGDAAADGSSFLEPRALFREAEVRAERTLGLVRVAIALILAAAFLTSEAREPPPDVEVVWRQMVAAAATILGFLLLGLISWGLARSGRLQPWHGWVFAALDVLLLLGSIYFGLVNTDLTVDHISVLPAIWLIPLVFGFGALRVNPYQQVFVTLILGVGLLMTPMLGTDLDPEARPELVWLFFETPPNVMRWVMIASGGILIAVAAARTRRLLRRAIEEGAKRRQLTRYLPPELAGRLAETSAAELRRGQRHAAAILFTDIRDFTGRCERLSPDDLGDFLSEFRHRVARAVQPHGGVIDKFVGDAALVVFGLPEPSPEDARNALAAGRALLAEVAEWSSEYEAADWQAVKLGIGIHHGEVFAGAVGDDTRLEFTVLGDTVNVAARLEALSKPLDSPLVVSAELLAEADEPESDWIEWPAQRLRGKTAETRVFTAP